MRLEPQPIIPRDPEAMHRRLSELLRKLHDTVNALSEYRASARYTAQAAPPSQGVFAAGDYVPNSAPAKLGTPGSRYVIYGWLRLVSGNAHVVGVDWVADQRLTGD
jgi:hypothetical protein